RARDPSHQIVVARLLDLDAHDLAGARLAAIDVHLPVDLRRLPHPASFQQQVGFLRDAFDQHVQDPSYETLLVVPADLPLDAEELLLPLRLEALGQLAGELERLRSFLARELEHTHLLEPHLLDEVAELLELLFRLAREAGDEAGPEGETGNAGADLAHQPAHP